MKGIAELLFSFPEAVKSLISKYVWDPKSNFLCPRSFLQIKPNNNVTWFVIRSSLCPVSIQTISI